MRRAGLLLSGLAAAVVLAGCEVATESDVASSAPVSEQQQAKDRAIATIVSHCRRKPKPRSIGDPRSRAPASAEQARGGVRVWIKALRKAHDWPYPDQYEIRDALIAMADAFERAGCLSDQIPVIDRVLRRVPLPEPTGPTEEEMYYEQSAEDQYDSYR